jgi:hypothetical protein
LEILEAKRNQKLTKIMFPIAEKPQKFSQFVAVDGNHKKKGAKYGNLRQYLISPSKRLHINRIFVKFVYLIPRRVAATITCFA